MGWNGKWSNRIALTKQKFATPSRYVWNNERRDCESILCPLSMLWIYAFSYFFS
jgi:hypothetical protein